MTSRTHGASVLSLMLAWSTACSDPPAPLGVCDGEGCPEECVALKGPDCDVRKHACQERIFQAVECVRGTPGTLPEIRLLTEDELRAEREDQEQESAATRGMRAVAKLLDGTQAGAGELLDAAASDAGDVTDAATPDAGSTPDAGGDLLDASVPMDASLAEAGIEEADAAAPEPAADGGPTMDAGAEVGEHWDTALELLGLRVAMPAMDQVDDVAGQYDPITQRITLVDRAAPQDTPSAQSTLAHELVHALQDQHYGILELWRGRLGTTDAQLASGCLTEGEAMLYEQLSWGLLQGLPVDRGYWEVLFRRYDKYNRDAVAAGDAPWDRLWLLRYGLGARYLADAWLAGGNAAVARVIESPPGTSAHWMHGYAAAQTRSEPLALSLRCNDAAVPPEFKRVDSDSFGAFTLFAFLAHNLAMDGVHPTEASWRRALAWRQDRLELYVGSDGETALSWRIRFADASTATAVTSDLQQRAPLKLRVIQRDDEVQILARENSAALDAWPITEPGQCPPSAW